MRTDEHDTIQRNETVKSYRAAGRLPAAIGSAAETERNNGITGASAGQLNLRKELIEDMITFANTKESGERPVASDGAPEKTSSHSNKPALSKLGSGDREQGPLIMAKAGTGEFDQASGSSLLGSTSESLFERVHAKIKEKFGHLEEYH